MRRRRLLALCGSFVAGSGCLDVGDAGPADETVTPVPRSPERATDDPEAPGVEVQSAVVQPGVVAPNSPDSIGVHADAGQYLVVIAAVGGYVPTPSAFEFHFDGETYSPAEFTRGLYRNGEFGVRYSDGNGGPLVFPLPETGDAGDARLTWPDDEWTPPARVRSRLEAPLPSFEVAMDGPTTVTESDDPRLTVSVSNDGDTAGRFVLALNRTGPRVAYTPVARIAGELGPGESTTRTFDAESPYVADPPREAIYRLDAVDDDNDARVTISPAESETPTRTPEKPGESTATDSE